MAKVIIKNPVVTVNSVDLSDHIEKATVETQFDEVDLSAFGSTYKVKGQGLGDAKITLTVQQDYAAGSVDATLWPLSQSGGSFPVTVRPTSSAKAATNPSYEMTAILLSYNPFDGAIGDKSTTDVTLENAAQTGLQRVTS